MSFLGNIDPFFINMLGSSAGGGFNTNDMFVFIDWWQSNDRGDNGQASQVATFQPSPNPDNHPAGFFDGAQEAHIYYNVAGDSSGTWQPLEVGVNNQQVNTPVDVGPRTFFAKLMSEHVKSLGGNGNQVRIIHTAFGGSRLRINTGTYQGGDDWNYQTYLDSKPSFPLNQREYFFSLFNGQILNGLTRLQTDFPNANIRIIGCSDMGGEADANTNTDAGDDPGLTGAQAQTAHENDLNAFYDGMRVELFNASHSISELRFFGGLLNGGANVINRPHYSNIRAAKTAVAASRSDFDVYETNTFEVAGDGVHFTINGQYEQGLAWFNHYKQFIT